MFCLSFVWFSLTNFVQGDHPTELDLFSPWDKVESIHSHKRIPGDPGSACREFHKPGPYRLLMPLPGHSYLRGQIKTNR